jgi:hypothetical protein
MSSDRVTVRLVHAEEPQGADLDVLAPDGAPLFRVLLPEDVTATNAPALAGRLNHCTAGAWRDDGPVHAGVVRADGWMEARIGLLRRAAGVLVSLQVTNLSEAELLGARADICIGVVHLPSPSTPWANRAFIPAEVPLDRDAAGRAWYGAVAPSRLYAYAGGAWTPLHPKPETPSPDLVPKYPVRREAVLDQSSVIAVDTLDGRNRLFAAWDVPVGAVAPFPGNACFHVLPLLAEALAPGCVGVARGEIAVANSPREDLARWSAEAHAGAWRDIERVLSALEAP